MSTLIVRQLRTFARRCHGVSLRRVSSNAREDEFFARVLQRFPTSTADGLCFAYGSAVFRQAGNASKVGVETI